MHMMCVIEPRKISVLLILMSNQQATTRQTGPRTTFGGETGGRVFLSTCISVAEILDHSHKNHKKEEQTRVDVVTQNKSS